MALIGPVTYHDLRKQPIRTIYLVYSLLRLCLVRVPLWTLLSIPPSWRGRKTWSIFRNVAVNVLRFLNRLQARVGSFVSIPNHKAITAGKGVKGIWVGAVPNLVAGDLKTWAETSNVKPINIPGYWIDKTGYDLKAGVTAAAGEKVFYHLHGGAYILMSAHASQLTTQVVHGLLKHSSVVTRTFCLEYRLSHGPPHPASGPFPAAIMDALAGYNYLINVVKFPPENVIVHGDSAGGNLALALTRYLVEYQDVPDMPAPPGGLLLLSPWVDLGTSRDFPGSSVLKFTNVDYVPGNTSAITLYAKRSYLGPHGFTAAQMNPYISPASEHLVPEISFRGFPRTMIVAGGAEMLLDQIRALKSRMEKDLGDDVTYYEAQDAIHDHLMFPWFEPQWSDTHKAISKWVSEKL